MRKTLAVLTLLAAAAAPAGADPIADAYNLVYSQCPHVEPDPLGQVAYTCAQFDMRYQYSAPMGCSVINVKHPDDGSYTYIFAGATAFSPWVTEIRTECWNESVPRWRAIQIVPGPASVMGPQRFPGMPDPGDTRICTLFKMRFGDNPWGYTPGVEYSGETYCVD